MLKIGNVNIKNKVVLAPMAGISNSAYRRICKEMGCGLVFAEMVSDKAISFGNDFHWILGRANSENMLNLVPEEKYWLFALENLMAMRQACLIGELTESQIEDVFFNNAKRLFGV